MNPVLFAVIVILLIAVFFKYASSLLEVHHVYKLGSQLPGPKATPLLGNSLQIPQNFAEWVPFFTGIANEQLKKGHTVMRLWIAHSLKVFPLNGKAAKEIIDSTEEITKSDDYDIIQPWLGTGLLISTGDKWRSRRRMLTPTFHFSMLDGYVESMDRESHLLTEILEPYADKKEEVDIFPFIKRCALDIICDTAMGYKLNCQKEKNHPYAIAVGEMADVATAYFVRPWLWFAPIWHATGYAYQYNTLLKTLTDFTKDVIQERQGNFSAEEDASEKPKRKAFLDMLLSAKTENNLTDEDIREEVDTFMFEGHDTTASGMSFAVWCIATHPEIQEKIYQELYKIFGNSQREITIDDLKQMSYLDRVLKESLRLNPPVPFVGRRMNSDFNMDGYIVPKGGLIFLSPLIIHRNPEAFPNPHAFDPDRFLPEHSKNRHAYDYIPFSAGPRNCIGQKFAMYEEKILVAWLLRKYKLSSSKKFEDNKVCVEMILRPSLGVNVFLESR